MIQEALSGRKLSVLLGEPTTDFILGSFNKEYEELKREHVGIEYNTRRDLCWLRCNERLV